VIDAIQSPIPSWLSPGDGGLPAAGLDQGGMVRARHRISTFETGDAAIDQIMSRGECGMMIHRL